MFFFNTCKYRKNCKNNETVTCRSCTRSGQIKDSYEYNQNKLDVLSGSKTRYEECYDTEYGDEEEVEEVEEGYFIHTDGRKMKILTNIYDLRERGLDMGLGKYDRVPGGDGYRDLTMDELEERISSVEWSRDIEEHRLYGGAYSGE